MHWRLQIALRSTDQIIRAATEKERRGLIGQMSAPGIGYKCFGITYTSSLNVYIRQASMESHACHVDSSRHLPTVGLEDA